MVDAMTPRPLARLVLLCGVVACGESDRQPTAISATGIATGGSATSTTDATSGSPTDGGTGPGTAGSSSSGTSAGSPKLDVGADDDTGTDCDTDCEPTGCTAVDLLFVIDNSASMQPYQAALAQAFPTFAQTIIEDLEPGVNLHVGVTSTEMGFSSVGMNSTEFVNGQAVACTATGDGDANSDTFYQTPDVAGTGTNGAQGRLYTASGIPYFDINTDAPPAMVTELETWFSAAAQIGEGGSNVEMSAAAAAWMTDPANSAANDGFLRDEGAVLVLFFIQDEHDQTPVAESAALLNKIGDAKQMCGGFECVVGGGFVNEDCLGLTPLGDLFNAFGGAQVVTETLPAPAAVTPQTFESALRDTLAQVIVDTCEQIEPPA